MDGDNGLGALKVLLNALQLDSIVYLLHSLRKGRATTSYRAGTDQFHIKYYGMWLSDAFLASIRVPCITDSPVVAELTGVTAATL